MFCDNREELISYYKRLSDAADLRTAKARWRVRRHQLDERRADFLQSESSWPSSAIDKPGIRKISDDSKSETFIPLPSSSVEISASLRDSGDKLADAPLFSAADVPCDLSDIVFEGTSSGSASGRVSLPHDAECAERPQKQAAYRHVSKESTETEVVRHVCTVSDQHVGKETVSATERLYVKLIPDQSVDAETSQVDDRIHLRMSSLASATTESQEVPEHAVVKLVDGRHVSHETAKENAVKPSIRLHAERHATMETDPSLLVCLVSVYTFNDCLCHNQVELLIDLRFTVSVNTK